MLGALATRWVTWRAGIPRARVRLLRAFAVRVRGAWLLLRPVSPQDFLGEEMHPFMPYREAKDFVGDKAAQAATERDSADPVRAAAVLGNIRKAYRPLLMKAVLWPPVSEKERPGAILIDDLLDDLDVANKIVEKVAEATLGKAVRPGTSWASSQSRRTPLLIVTACCLLCC